MKKNLLAFATVLLGAFAFSQVGVDTDLPTETLDVNGTVRVQNLPANGSVTTINTLPDGTAGVNDFTATRTVVADVNGVLGYVDDVVTEGTSETVTYNGNTYEVYTPEERCVKGAIGGGVPDKTIVFENTGYEFAFRDVAASVGEVQVRRTPTYATSPTDAKNFVIGGNTAGIDAGFLTIGDNNNSWDRLIGVSYSGGLDRAAEGTLIIQNTAQSFKYTVATINQSSGRGFYAFCVRQMTF